MWTLNIEVHSILFHALILSLHQFSGEQAFQEILKYIVKFLILQPVIHNDKIISLQVNYGARIRITWDYKMARFYRTNRGDTTYKVLELGLDNLNRHKADQ